MAADLLDLPLRRRVRLLGHACLQLDHRGVHRERRAHHGSLALGRPAELARGEQRHRGAVQRIGQRVQRAM
jgi:hypothetical protein